MVPAVVLGIGIGDVVDGVVAGLLRAVPGFAIVVAALVALVILAFGAATWGSVISRITSAGDEGRMARAGAVGVAPVVVVVALALTFFEGLFVEQRQLADVPLHNIYTLLFTPALAIVTGAGGLALSLGARQRATALILGVQCALGGGIAFLAVDLALDSLGWRVGAPGAEARITMLTTTLLGSLGAALIGGGIVGMGLTRGRVVPQPRPLL
jgi:hypothetical protein